MDDDDDDDDDDDGGDADNSRIWESVRTKKLQSQKV
jgi:hypothetical protein